MAEEKDTAARLEELRKRKEKREEDDKKELEALELEALEQEEKYITAGKKRGVDFEIMATLVGVFVVRRPEFSVARKFTDTDNKGTDEVIQFVDACMLYPERMMARAILQEHMGIAWDLALKCVQLSKAEVSAKTGKSKP